MPIFVPVDGRKYAAVSRQVMGILRRFTPAVEPVSIDEAFLEVAGSELLHGTPVGSARAIRAAIRDELRLTASVGVATTQARRQGRLRPSQARWPRGRGARGRGDVPRAAADLAPVGRGRADGSPRSADYGVRTIGDLASLPDDLLVRRFGRQGPSLAAARPRTRPLAGGRERGRQARSATSTPSTSTPPIRRCWSGRSWRSPRGSPSRLRRGGGHVRGRSP